MLPPPCLESGILDSPFEAMAIHYDRDFTGSLVGWLMRQAVWTRLEASFHPGDWVLELNCGTGEDALYLGRRGIKVLATDVSAAMLQVAGAKIRQAGLEGLVRFHRLDLEELAQGRVNPLRPAGEQNSQGQAARFDGAFSNFGGLNCVSDLPGVAAELASSMRGGAKLVLCLMGPLVPWEWLWFLWRRQPQKAFRRLAPRGLQWRGVRIYYPSIRGVRRAFGGHFRFMRASAIGALLPPPYAEAWAVGHPRLLARLNRWERRLETLPPLPWLADHYLLEFVRR